MSTRTPRSQVIVVHVPKPGLHTGDSPAWRAETCIEQLAAIEDEGYDTVRFCGPDPLNHPSFELAARAAANLGFTLEVQSQLGGMTAGHLQLLREIDATLLLDVTDHLSHPDAARREQTQTVLSQTTRVLRSHGVRFGLEAHVGDRDIPHLSAFAHFATQEGAATIHWHPRHCVVEGAMSTQGAARLYLLAKMVREASAGDITVQLDLTSVRRARAELEHLAATNADDTLPMADVIATLVIDEDGRFWPYAHDIDPQWCLTQEAPHHWRRTLTRWRSEGHASLRPLLQTAAACLQQVEDDFLSWNTHLRATAQPELVLEAHAAA